MQIAIFPDTMRFVCPKRIRKTRFFALFADFSLLLFFFFYAVKTIFFKFFIYRFRSTGSCFRAAIITIAFVQ